MASSRHIVPVDYSSITIADTAGTILTLADSGSPSTLPVGAQSFKGILETGAVRVRMDGTAPTDSEGELAAVGAEVILDASLIANAQFIRDTGTSGVLKGHYYNVEASVLLGGG